MLVYTAIFGPYDFLKEPEFRPDDLEFVCYTNQTPEALQQRPNSVWELRGVDVEDSELWAARRLKHNPPVKESLWIDGTVHLKKHPSEFIQPQHGNFACFYHTRRQCVYEEAEAAIARLEGQGRRDESERVHFQRNHYRKIGLPENNGLFETCVLYRRMDEQLQRFQERWWREMLDWSSRDQIALAKVSWQLGIEPKTLPRRCMYRTKHNPREKK